MHNFLLVGPFRLISDDNMLDFVVYLYGLQTRFCLVKGYNTKGINKRKFAQVLRQLRLETSQMPGSNMQVDY
jgi:hypothetical protein